MTFPHQYPKEMFKCNCGSREPESQIFERNGEEMSQKSNAPASQTEEVYLEELRLGKTEKVQCLERTDVVLSTVEEIAAVKVTASLHLGIS